MQSKKRAEPLLLSNLMRKPFKKMYSVLLCQDHSELSMAMHLLAFPKDFWTKLQDLDYAWSSDRRWKLKARTASCNELLHQSWDERVLTLILSCSGIIHSARVAPMAGGECKAGRGFGCHPPGVHRQQPAHRLPGVDSRGGAGAHGAVVQRGEGQGSCPRAQSGSQAAKADEKGMAGLTHRLGDTCLFCFLKLRRTREVAVPLKEGSRS